MNVLRRLALSRLLLLLGVILAVGIGATALASALDAGPTPEPKALPQAIHDALAGSAPEGISANVQLTNHLLEGASLAGQDGGGGGLLSSPLLNGGSGRMWVSRGGKVRLELQSERGDTEVLYDGHTLELYDAANNTLYRYTPQHEEGEAGASEGEEHSHHQVPSVAKIEEALSHLEKHAKVSDAAPTDVAGQPAYNVALSPREGGSLLDSVQLAFDANNALPLRVAVYAAGNPSPVLELAASEISFEAVDNSIFELNPPSNAKVEELKPENTQTSTAGRARAGRRRSGSGATAAPKVTVHGQGPGAIAVLETKASRKGGAASSLRGLPQVQINGAKASELRTALGTLLTFERHGVRYLLVGSVKPGALEALASGL